MSEVSQVSRFLLPEQLWVVSINLGPFNTSEQSKPLLKHHRKVFLTASTAMCTPAASSVEKLQELFPQLNKETLQDVVTQTGDGAFEILLELCSTSHTLCSPLSAASWSDDSALLESHEDLSTASQCTGASWWDTEEKSGDASAAARVGLEADNEGMKLIESLRHVEKGGAEWGREAQEGWESISEGPLNLNDWGIVHVKSEEESVCSSEGLYCGAEGPSKKIEFLAVMFAEYGVDDAMIREVLEDVEGDMDLAVDRLLETTCKGNEHSDLLWERKEESRISFELGKEAVCLLEQNKGVFRKSQNEYPRNSPSLEANENILCASRMEGACGKRKLYNSKLIRKAQELRRQFCNYPEEDIVLNLLESLQGDSEAAAQALRDTGLKEVARSSLVKPVPPSIKPQYSRTSGTVPLVNPKTQHQSCSQVPPRKRVEMSQCDFEALYNEERSQAKHLGNLKSLLFKQATLAYEKGDKTLAKKLSLEVSKTHNTLFQSEIGLNEKYSGSRQEQHLQGCLFFIHERKK